MFTFEGLYLNLSVFIIQEMLEKKYIGISHILKIPQGV